MYYLVLDQLTGEEDSVTMLSWRLVNTTFLRLHDEQVSQRHGRRLKAFMKYQRFHVLENASGNVPLRYLLPYLYAHENTSLQHHVPRYRCARCLSPVHQILDKTHRCPDLSTLPEIALSLTITCLVLLTEAFFRRT